MKKPLIFRTLSYAVFSVSVIVMGGQFFVLDGQTERGTSLSRSMEQAIRLYHDGQDNEAMDRFMDILVKGTPSEKSLANDYISKITLRMNSGAATLKDSAPEEGSLRQVPGGGQRQPPGRETRPLSPGGTPETEDGAGPPEQQQRERVSAKISEKIAEMRANALLELNKYEGVKIFMGDSMPRALTVNPGYLFASETAFKPNAAALLSNLAGLIFTLGKANCLVLPEGTVENDVKIRGIRRAIALNSYFVSRGLSQSRIDVNLTGTEIKFPKELSGITGIAILFDYEKEPRLAPADDLQAKGPRVSLGIYPTAISVQKNEGALVEFSVFDSPSGKPSWRFEIFAVQPDGTLIQLQKIDGYGPQYNQSYWNGRKNFFGAAYPSGKYVFSITAVDTEGRETYVRRLLVIKPTAEEEKALLAKRAAAAGQAAASGKRQAPRARPAAKAGIASRQISGPGPKAALRKGKAGFKKNPRTDRKAGLSAPKPPPRTKGAGTTAPAGESPDPPGQYPKDAAAGPQNAEDMTGFSGQVSYKIFFREATAVVTPNSEKKIVQVAETMNYYPMARVKLIGYAYSGEANPQTMADNRVNYVATRLAAKYKIERDRMDVTTQIADMPKSIVEIKMVGKE